MWIGGSSGFARTAERAVLPFWFRLTRLMIAVQMETGFLVPGLDPGINPGIAPTDGIRGDPWTRSGDDDKGAVHGTMAISAAHFILMPMGGTPANPRLSRQDSRW
jgi:hypothetical protein